MKTPEEYAATIPDADAWTVSVIAEAMADARRAALEEAAKVADRFKGDVRYPMTADHIADEIRALLDSPDGDRQ